MIRRALFSPWWEPKGTPQHKKRLPSAMLGLFFYVTFSFIHDWESQLNIFVGFLILAVPFVLTSIAQAVYGPVPPTVYYQVKRQNKKNH